MRYRPGYLGVPQEIIDKPPSPDLIPGITDELALGIPYARLDRILSLLAQGRATKEIGEVLGIPPQAVAEVRQAMNHVRAVRRLPFSLLDKQD
jgi:NAD+ synthase